MAPQKMEEYVEGLEPRMHAEDELVRCSTSIILGMLWATQILVRLIDKILHEIECDYFRKG